MFIKPDVSIHELKNVVIRLSDFFIQFPNKATPWEQNYCQLAYKHYFLPLNYLRNELVLNRGQELKFFLNLDTVIDWGAGPGTASFALASQLNIKEYHLVEKSVAAKKVFWDLQKEYLKKVFQYEKMSELPRLNNNTTLLVVSYAFTENSKLPEGYQNYEALMILEPSTKDDGRRLMQIRSDLIKEGYHIWAPCIHQLGCPLLLESKNDWCHDRVAVVAPDWFKQLDQLLPFKNKTITTSYLLARRSRPQVDLSGHNENPRGEVNLTDSLSVDAGARAVDSVVDLNNKARLVGDSLNEKGKTKQLLCRGPEREFLTWMHKEIEPKILARGDLITMPSNFEKKSNELRVKK